jgi:hypothetical protein
MKFEYNLGHIERVSEDQELNSIFLATDHEDQTLEGCIEFQIILHVIYMKFFAYIWAYDPNT